MWKKWNSQFDSTLCCRVASMFRLLYALKHTSPKHLHQVAIRPGLLQLERSLHWNRNPRGGPQGHYPILSPMVTSVLQSHMCLWMQVMHNDCLNCYSEPDELISSLSGSLCIVDVKDIFFIWTCKDSQSDTILFLGVQRKLEMNYQVRMVWIDLINSNWITLSLI